MSVLMTSALFMFVRVRRRLACRLCCGSHPKLMDLPFFATESVHHANRTQSLLDLHQHRTFLLLNKGRLPPDAICEKINRADEQGNNGNGKESQLPVEPPHDHESADQRDDRAEDVGESLVINRLDRLRVVGHAKTGIGRTPRVVKLQGERLQIGVKIGAQFEQRLQTDFYKNVSRHPAERGPTNWRRTRARHSTATQAVTDMVGTCSPKMSGR